MKTENQKPVEGVNQTKGVNGSHDDTNQINIGSVGLEGGGDNGASALRDLRKKHSGSSINRTRRPLL
jgi:hypothetical protein